MSQKTPEQFPGVAAATGYAIRQVPGLARIRHRWCGTCDQDHRHVHRHYAHHVCESDTICWAKALAELPPENAAGICLHEYGHVLAQNDPGRSDFEAERAADKAVMEVLGVEMQYRGKDDLQWVDLKELR